MPYFICALMQYLREQSAPMGYCVIRKCRKSEVRGEFWCFLFELRYRLRLGFPNPARYRDHEHFTTILRDAPGKEFLSKFEEACPALRGTVHLQIVKKSEDDDEFGDRVFLSLDRSALYTRVLAQVLTDGMYGCCDVYKGNVVRISINGDDNSLTLYRVQMVCEILKRVVNASGGSPVDTSFDASVADKISCFCITSKEIECENGEQLIRVGYVHMKTAESSIVSVDDCKSAFSEELALMNEHRLDDESDIAVNSQDALRQASLMFAFINGNISKRISLRLDTNITPFCKGAVFVLYNYCRMAHIIHKYKTMEREGTYPPLPDVESVDFTLLTKPEEWSMMYEFVICWPEVFETIVSRLRYGDFKVHKILEFLKSLASTFSAYYRRTRVLTEPRPSLLPVLHARIYLILALKKVYKAALDILGLQPLQNM